MAGAPIKDSPIKYQIVVRLQLLECQDVSNVLAYLDGQMRPASEASLALSDAGFVMGVTVTDLCRTVHHKLYRWEDHLTRFRNSCRAAGLNAPLSDEELTRIASELVAHNAALLRPEEDLALLIFITPGPIGYYVGLPAGLGDATPTFGMHTFPLPLARYRRLFQEGVRLAVASTRQVPRTSVDPQIKHRSRLHWWLADREVHNRHPGAAAVLLDEHGHLTETVSANLLIVKKGIVQSPPRDTILPGVSLKVLEELCHDQGLTFVERPLTVVDAKSADEILLTSTPYCLCGVSRFEGAAVPWPGSLLRLLLTAWGGKIGLDIEKQVMLGSTS
jgi:branched-subunit amino acid aminotransferase/4-amino-4-deoxychorismate lyase